jgi:N-acetylglucosamine-6-sulfatase
VRGQISNIDFAPTLLDAARAKPGRIMDGVSLYPTMRHPRLRPKRTLQTEALAPLLRRVLPANQWDRPYKGVRTDRYTYVVYRETGEQELYDRKKDPHQLTNVAAVGAYAGIKTKLAAKLEKLDKCRGRSCNVR